MAQLKYEQIKSYLQAEAVKPESATRMPTVRELMRRFNVSLVTVNRALSELEHAKVIVRRQGAGIVAARSSREVARLEAEPESGRKCLAFAYNDYPDENIWNTIHMIAQYTRQHGCNLLDCKIYPDTPTETILNLVQSRTDCAGLVLLFGSDRMDREQLEALGRLPMRVVAVDSMFFYSDFLPDNVYVLSPDGADCAEKMAEVLVRRGHRRIGYIRNEPRSEYTDLHLKAFGAALKRAGVEFGPEQIFSATIRSWEKCAGCGNRPDPRQHRRDPAARTDGAGLQVERRSAGRDQGAARTGPESAGGYQRDRRRGTLVVPLPRSRPDGGHAGLSGDELRGGRNRVGLPDSDKT